MHGRARELLSYLPDPDGAALILWLREGVDFHLEIVGESSECERVGRCPETTGKLSNCLCGHQKTY